jgi:hypothetical protein
MNALKNYSWEATLVAIIGSVITTGALVTHLTARTERPGRAPPEATALFGPSTFHPVPDRMPVTSITPPIQVSPARKVPLTARAARHPSKSSDPLEVIIGTNPIGGQLRLLTVTRTPVTPTSDKLILGIRMMSRATPPLVTPFQSTILEVRSRALEPIKPEHPLSFPVPAGNTREEDVAFIIPSDLNLDHSVLRIQYYNEQKEIPLSLLPRDSRH